MEYDFDKIIDRHGTGSLKFDCAERRGKSKDLLPLWVADMDFPVPDEVVDALVNRSRHAIFGYTEPTDSYFEAVTGWLENHHGWKTNPRWYVLTPGVVFALAAAVCAFTEPGESVIIQQPVYYPFSEVVNDNGRKLVNCPLVYSNGAYSIDFDAFEHAVEQEDVKLFLLCNPHNPGGRVWSRDELRRLGDICNRHGVVVVSDEIHADFNRPGYEHVVYASLGEEYAQNSITCTSPGKTFNMASLQVSNIIIPNQKLRRTFRHSKTAFGYSQMNALGLAATEAAYKYGESWFLQLKEYLEGNYVFLKSFIEERLPQLTNVELGSTYLAWIDCRALGLDDNGLKHLVEDGAKLWLDMGDVFGPDGSGFIRINFATQRSVLEQALEQLESAVNGYLASRGE